MFYTLLKSVSQALMSLRTAKCDGYGRRKPQVDKRDQYMFTALWMQESPWAFKSTEDLNVVGSVFVLPNDRVLSVDCTRKIDDHDTLVHGAIRPLIKYPDRAEGCQVYLTRKPCAHCVKMLIQARVSQVFYLPLPPERPKPEHKEENKSVVALFQVSEVSKSFYIPNISQKYIDELQKDPNAPYERNTEGLQKRVEEFKEKIGWNEDWYLPKHKPVSNLQHYLDWQEYGEKKIREQVLQDMDNAFEWFYLATFATGQTDEMKWDYFGKSWKEPFDEKVATHLSRLAQMLSNRTDDPRTGVGCVITNEEEIVSIGWNGFPSKALYGNHPRGSAKDKNVTKMKYPHIIYAAQNALLNRNQRNFDENSVVYMNTTPGDGCMPLLYEVGVRKLVLPFFDEEQQNPYEKEKKCFYELLKRKKIAVQKRRRLSYLPQE